MFARFSPALALAWCVILLRLVHAADEHNTRTASADKTAFFDAQTLSPSIVYQESVAGQFPAPQTYYTYVTKTATTVQIPVATETIAQAAFEVSTDQIGYLIPMRASVPWDTDSDIPSARAICWYPVSGYYGRLARYLFYVTMFFAVFARRFEWLIMGALATGLTYSSIAAIQALIMVWSNQGIGNPDGVIILGLLGFSLAMLVPLLNWSSTINKLGAEREEDSVGRSIIIAWGGLLTIAFMTLFIGIWKQQDGSTLEDLRKAIKTPMNYLWVAAKPNITCSPASGVLDMAAGQDARWPDFFITSEFVDANNCQNPCAEGINWPIVEWSTILRDPSDLRVLDLHQINTFWAAETDQKVLNQDQLLGREIASSFLVFGTPFMVLLIVQGIWAVLLSRRSPAQARNLVYWLFTKFLPRKPESNEPARWVHLLGKTMAILVYLYTLFTSLVAVVLLVLSMFTTEWFAHEIPSSDHSFTVDQWSGMVSAAIVLLTAVIFQFQAIAQDIFFRLTNRLILLIHNSIHHKRKNFCTEGSKANIITKAPTDRVTNKTLLWESFRSFFTLRHHRLRADGPDAPRSKPWLQDWKEFLHDPRKVIKRHDATGGTHVRARRIAGEEHAHLIDSWNKTAGDDWLDLEEFIAALRKFDMRQRGHERFYKFKPRIIEEGEAEERTRFNWKLMADIFRKHNQRYTWNTMSADDYNALSRQGTDQTMVSDHTAMRSGQGQRDPKGDALAEADAVGEEGIQMHSMATPEQSFRPFATKHAYTPL